MGRFNLYQSDLKYTPQSFEKMALLPMQLRKEHDQAEADKNLIELNVANTKVAAGYQDQYNSVRQGFDQKSAEISEKLSKQGAGDPTLMNEFKNLKRQYNLAAASTGILGAGSQRYKEELEAEKVYTEYGVTKAKQSPDAVTAQWKAKMQRENDEIKAGFAADKNYVPKQMVHEYAPDFYDTTIFAKNMKDIIGMSGGSSSTDLSAGLIPDGNGQMSINTHSTAWKNNKEQLQAFAKLMNEQLFDSSSKLNQHLKYNNKDPKNYLGDVQKLVDIMTVSEENSADKINPFGGGSGSGGQETTTENSKDIVITARTERAEHASIELAGINNGQKTMLSTENAETIERSMEEMENRGDPVTLTKEYSAAKQIVADKASDVRVWKKLNEKEINAAAVSEGYVSFDKFLERRSKERDVLVAGITASKSAPGKDGMAGAQNKLADFDKKTKEIKSSILEKSGIEEGMFNQVHYGAGNTDGTNEIYNKTVDFLVNSGQLISDQIGKNSFVYDIDQDGKRNLSEVQSINVAAAKSVKLTSFATKNMKGAPSIGIDFVLGEGKDLVTKHLDLEVGPDDNSIARNVVTRMLKGATDPETVYALEAILDSASANQIIPDSNIYRGSTKYKSGASKIQSDSIITFNNAVTKNAGKGTIKKDGSYQMITQGAHFSLNVKQKGDADYHVYNIGDLMNDVSTSSDPRINQNQKNAEVQALVMLMKYKTQDGVNSFKSKYNPIVPEDSGSKRNALALALDEYIEATPNGSNLTTAMRDAATNAFLAKVSNVGLKSMNKAAFLKF